MSKVLTAEEMRMLYRGPMHLDDIRPGTSWKRLTDSHEALRAERGAAIAAKEAAEDALAQAQTEREQLRADAKVCANALRHFALMNGMVEMFALTDKDVAPSHRRAFADAAAALARPGIQALLTKDASHE